MGVALVIVGGLVLITFVTTGLDFLSKRHNRLDDETRTKVQELERQVRSLEATAGDREERIAQLETEIAFVRKLLDDRQKGVGGL